MSTISGIHTTRPQVETFKFNSTPDRASSVAGNIFKGIGAAFAFLGSAGCFFGAAAGVINPVVGIITGVALAILGIILLATMNGNGSASAYATVVTTPVIRGPAAPVIVPTPVIRTAPFIVPTPVLSTPTGHAPVGVGRHVHFASPVVISSNHSGRPPTHAPVGGHRPGPSASTTVTAHIPKPDGSGMVARVPVGNTRPVFSTLTGHAPVGVRK